MRRSDVGAYLLFALVCAIWGATWIATKVGLATVPPVLFAGTRFVVAGAALLAYLRLRGRPLRVAREHRARLALATAFMVVATYSLLFVGAATVSSGLAAIVNLTTLPVVLLAIGVAAGEERFGRARAAAIGLGVAGILALFGPKVAGSGAASPAELRGAALVLLSAVAYGLGSVLARPVLRAHPPALVSGLSLLGGGVVMTVGAVLLEPGAAAALDGRWGLEAWAGWLYLVLCGSLMAFTLYLRLLRDWGPSAAGSYAFVSPVIAVLLGVVVLGEEVTASELPGMATMLAAAWLALRARPDAPAARTAAVEKPA